MEKSVQTTRDGILNIEVIDTGVGIEKLDIDNLFKPYSTANKEHHKTFGGTGLGLWISKVIVELMGGKIRCKSQIGKGTNFAF